MCNSSALFKKAKSPFMDAALVALKVAGITSTNMSAALANMGAAPVRQGKGGTGP